jgi:hypothetical protein
MNTRDENMAPTITNTELEEAVHPQADSTKSGTSEGEKKTESLKPAPETETTATATETASSKKRPAATTVETAVDGDDDEPAVEPSKRGRHEQEEEEGVVAEGEVLDLANTLGFKPGDRFEVEWEVSTEDESDESGGDAATTAVAGEEEEQETFTTRWWGATLLEHDGRTEDSVAVRVLDYDPYPEGGFLERSREEVIFLGRDELIDPNTHAQMHYRLEGDVETVWLGREGVEEVVNATLANAMQKNSKSWNGLSRAQQASIADIIAKKKEKLLELLLSQANGVVTTTEMHAIIAKTMQE